MSESKLGHIPSGEEGRDAVHVAIIPVRAGQRLRLGQRVRLTHVGRAVPAGDDAIGVVDPFLTGKRSVGQGEWFWLCLYPGTVTSLRHHWEHPGIPSSAASKDPMAGVSRAYSDVAASKTWVRDYVQTHCSSDSGSSEDDYESFMQSVIDRCICLRGTDCHSMDEVPEREELFYHLTVILNIPVTDSYFDYVSCSC